MDTWIQDLRYGVRQWRKQPGFAVVALVTLGLSTGVAAALFSVIDGALIRTLPYPHPEQLVTLGVQESDDGGGRPVGLDPSMADIRTWRAVRGILAHAGMGRVSGFAPLVVDTGQAERVVVATASEDFLETYGVAPLFGRSIRIEDTREGATPVALLGHAFWERHFGGDRGVLGTTIRVQNAPVTIIGVLPAGFYDDTCVWQAQMLPAASLDRRGSGTPVIARLQPGITIAQATQALQAVTAGAPAKSAAKIEIASMYGDETDGYGTTLALLASAVGLIVLIACVNVGGLLLARGASREAELSIRASIGASRGRIVRQLLTESLLLAGVGALLGLALASLSLDSLVAWIPLRLPANSPPRIDATVLGCSLALTMVTALLFGVIPALKLSRAGSNLSSRLASGGRGGGGHLSRRAGQRLIGVEVALALVLLAGAGLVVKSFAKLMSVDLGFDPARVLALEVEPLDQTPSVRDGFYRSLAGAIRGMPDVAAAGALNQLALTGGGSYGAFTTDTGRKGFGPQRPVLPGYFEALGVQPRAGRLPQDADLRAGGAAVVSASLADQWFGGDAIGHTLDVGAGPRARTLRVVGVVADLKLGGPRARVEPQLFLTAAPTDERDGSFSAMAILIRPRDGASIGIDRLKPIADAIGPRVLVGRLRPLSDVLGQNVAAPRHRMLLLALLGGFGLLLTLVGIFSMTAYAVSRRTREIGVRLAFGARAGEVVLTIVRDAIWPVAIGLAVGLAGAYYGTRVIASFLYETTPHDPATLAAVVAGLGVAAVLAAWLPARRAATVDPVLALRAE